MPTNTLDGLRAEINAKLKVINPEMSGFEALALVPFSDATKAAIVDARAKFNRRRDRLTAVILALDALDLTLVALNVDGYPADPSTDFTDQVIVEVQKRSDEIAGTLALFGVTQGPGTGPSSAELVALAEVKSKIDSLAAKAIGISTYPPAAIQP